MYTKLNPEHIIKTLNALDARICERFPGSGLARVCRELTGLAEASSGHIAELARPNIILRTAILSVVVLGALMLSYLASIIEVKRDAENLFGVMQGIDSVFNIVVLMGAGIIFLVSLEDRWKRQKAMEYLHELRSIIHVIDMHQLPKDPSSARPPTVATLEPAGPQRAISNFELTRYLDYCSEMLSLAAKVAALYAQSTRDPLVVEAASELGQITTNLSNKIWQKISMVYRIESRSLPLPTQTAGDSGIQGHQPHQRVAHPETS